MINTNMCTHCKVQSETLINIDDKNFLCRDCYESWIYNKKLETGWRPKKDEELM